LLVLLALVAILARAEEWHEAYRNGVNALARGQGERAVELLERAAAQRPQPGRNVVTYGTNVEQRYYPYLRLAEAYLLLRNLEGARSSLKRSESWGGEPAAERARLLAQVEEAAARLAAPPTTRTPPTTAPPPPERAPPTTEAAPTPTPVPPPTPSLATPEPVRAAPPPRRASSPETVPSSRDPGREAPAEGACSLEVVSNPAGASVYLDDELIGATDPEWGRLVRNGVPPGRHRIRLALAGHRDLAEEVELRAGGLTIEAMRRRLVRRWRRSQLGARVGTAAGSPEDERREEGRTVVARLARRLARPGSES